MNILITGGRGGLAHWLIKYHVNAGDEVYLLKNVHEKHIDNVRWIDLNVLIASRLHFQVVYHLAAMVSKDKKLGHLFFKNNVSLTEILTTTLMFDRFVYASSVSVYKAGVDVINENGEVDPDHPYSLSKFFGEWYVKQLPSYAILRFSSLYGVGMKLNTFLPNIIIQALQKKTICIFGDGSRKQDYLHYQDAVSYLIAAAKSKKNVIGLGVSGHSITNEELAIMVSEITKASIYFKDSDNSFSVSYDNSDTLDHLQMSQVSSNLKEHLPKLIEWIKNIEF